MSKESTLPLIDFYESLRKSGFALGMSEYQTLLDALQLGYGIDKQSGSLDKKALLQLCKTLWLKPNQSKFIFEELFDEKFNDFTQPKSLSQTQQSPSPFGDDKTDFSGNQSKSGSKGGGEDAITQEENQPEEKTKETESAGEAQGLIDTFSASFPPVRLVLGTPMGNAIPLPEDKRKSRKFIFTDYFFDLSKRQMQQICRCLPLYLPSGKSQDIDLRASVEAWARAGMIGTPLYQKKQATLNQILLLIDQDGSMKAFEQLADTFASALEAAFETKMGENKDKVKTFYFYNVPQEYSYKDKKHQQYEKTSQILQALKGTYSSVIIISDAGAARGGNSDARYKATLRFLIQLKKVCDKIVWLNPMPEERWPKTTAARIKAHLEGNMYALTDAHALQQAINQLKGKSKQ